MRDPTQKKVTLHHHKLSFAPCPLSLPLSLYEKKPQKDNFLERELNDSFTLVAS